MPGVTNKPIRKQASSAKPKSATTKRQGSKPGAKPSAQVQAKSPAPKVHRAVSSGGFVAAVGRRKEAVARVRLLSQGNGTITINGRSAKEYFTTADFLMPVLQPLQLAGLEKSVDVSVKVTGGGKVGQAEAIRLGIARALVIMDENYRKQMRPAGYLTRDARVKERKKYGLKKARRAPQFSKR